MASAQSEPPRKKSKRINFRWDENMHSDLIHCIIDYKTRCEFNGCDFDADKVAQYQALRLAMAKRYECNNDLFGPVDVTPPSRPLSELNEEEKAAYNAQAKQEKDLISRGHKRVMEKVKDLRQGFSKAVLAGRRSGSGKLVYDHYDELKLIWGGSPNTEPLPSGVDSDAVNQVGHGHQNIVEEDETPESHASMSSNEEASSSNSVVPKLIDEKRKHLQRKLSASQRDEILIGEAREEKLFRKEMADSLKTSTESFAGALNNISQSMVQISTSFSRSLEVLAQSIGPPQAIHPPFPRQTYGESYPRNNPYSYPATNMDTFNYNPSCNE